MFGVSRCNLNRFLFHFTAATVKRHFYGFVFVHADICKDELVTESAHEHLVQYKIYM